MPQAHYVEQSGAVHTVNVPEGQTLMEAAVVNRVPGIVGRCGGQIGCATCQVYLDQAWLARLPPPTREETRGLRYAFERAEGSRLACCLTMTDALDGIVMRIPRRQY